MVSWLPVDFWVCEEQMDLHCFCMAMALGAAYTLIFMSVYTYCNKPLELVSFVCGSIDGVETIESAL